jgi:transposase InsO family protein
MKHRRVKAHDLRLEGKVRRHGREPGAGSKATARREHEVAQAGGGSESGQGSSAVGDPKKRLELVALKAAIEQVQQEYAFSERRACRLMTMAVTTYRYRSQRTDEPLRTRLVELAREKPRFGYRRLQVLLQRSGEQVNHKRLHRVYREAGLAIRRKKRKHGVREGKPLAARTSADQEWGLDFVHDAVECGRTIRVLSVVDAYTRECLALEVDTSFASRRVTRVLDAIIAERGVPQAIRCDNGPFHCDFLDGQSGKPSHSQRAANVQHRKECCSL